MSDDPRRTQPFCTPDCYRVCQCSRWPDLLDRWGNPVNHGQGGGVIPDWWLAGGIAAADCLGAYRAINTPGSAWGPGPANYAASLVNLNGGAALAEIGGGSVTWAAATGWSDFSLLTRCLDTGIAPGVDRSISALCQYTGAAWPCTIFGCLTAGRGFMVQAWNVGDVIYWNPIAVTIAPAHVNGNTGMAGLVAFRDGIVDGPLVNGADNITDTIYIGALNNAGAAAQHFTGAIESFALYSVTITDAQMLAVATAMAAL